MIVNSKNCYYNTFCNNGKFYLKVTNKTPLCIRFIIQYTMQGKTVTKQSKFLTLDTSSTLNFSTTSTNICFNIVNYSLPSRPLICTGHIPIPKDTCYEVRGTETSPMCVHVPC